MMTIQWNTPIGYPGDFMKHAHASVSDDIGGRLRSITAVLKRGERGNEYSGTMLFGTESMQVSIFTAELIFDLLRAMGVRET
jgi:hypothetical protein